MREALLFTVTLFVGAFAIALVLQGILWIIWFIVEFWEDYTDASPSYLILLGVFLFIFLGARYIAENMPVEPSSCNTVYVSTVGWCDEMGTCGVTYSDGSFGNMRYPTKGQSHQVCN